MKNLNNFGVLELNANETLNINGGDTNMPGYDYHGRDDIPGDDNSGPGFGGLPI